ncbi:MAG: hypothetical protein Q8N48_05915 [Thiobacillus sp.]|nr:hypothetical protein [Thiobacillus sp.]MDP2254065.1 hypothetical protein [Thiobacillus sp.]MDP2978347.1 hypothetical protein [Thiobacillus sp.]
MRELEEIGNANNLRCESADSGNELRKNEARFSMIFNAAPDAIFLLDAAGKS